MNILIVDDDKNISDILSIALTNEGYNITVENNSIKAKDLIATTPFDLVILDIMMPEVDGYALCTHTRYFSDMPIIFITCLDDEQSLITALSLGGDDYIRKPFNLTEVVMRVKVHLRRVERSKINPKSNIYRTPALTFYHNRNTVVSSENDRIHLSPLESDILAYFFENIDTVISYKDLYETIWNEPYLRDKSTIMARISNLRNKLPILNINTVRGVGYVMNK